MSAKKAKKKTDKKTKATKPEANGVPIDVEGLMDSLNYLHPKNETTKKAYGVVVALQEHLNANTPEHLTGCYSASLTISYAVLEVHINNYLVWSSEQHDPERLTKEALLERCAEEFSNDSGVILGKRSGPNNERQEDAPANGEHVSEGGGFFVGRFTDNDGGEDQWVERLSPIDLDVKGILEMVPPSELPDVPDEYFIFKSKGIGDLSLATYRWTKKRRWKKVKKDMLGGILQY